RLDGPAPSAPRGHGPQENTVGFASSWLHPLRSWSFRETRGGSHRMTFNTAAPSWWRFHGEPGP
ncbi:hypothetical protein FV233_28955, partial [Methylobacterium sp. WL7]